MAQAKDSAFFGKVVTVLGGDGFVGRHLAQELLSRGARVRIVSRNPERAYALRPLGNVGQVQLMRADVTKPDTVRAAFDGADAVVNLVGAFTGDLDAIQGQGIGRVAALARDYGVTAYVHVSSLSADAQSPIAYARTKAEGEAATLAAFPGATILRPAILFGADDNFINLFARAIAALPVMPVFAPKAKLQPLYVDDAAAAIAQALAAPGAHGGKTYELAGPQVLTTLELNRRIAQAQNRERVMLELPDAVSNLIAMLPGAPVSRSQLALLEAGDLPSGALPGLSALGVAPQPLELYLDRWMVAYRKFGRFNVKAKLG